MAVSSSFFLQAMIPWHWAELILLGVLVTLILVRAIQQAAVGHEDETGFHYGSFEKDDERSSPRPARSVQSPDVRSCTHSRTREGKKVSRRPPIRAD